MRDVTVTLDCRASWEVWKATVDDSVTNEMIKNDPNLVFADGNATLKDSGCSFIEVIEVEDT